MFMYAKSNMAMFSFHLKKNDTNTWLAQDERIFKGITCLTSWNAKNYFGIGCSIKNFRGFPLNTPAMEHIKMQTRYHLMEVNLFDIMVYDFLFFQ